MNDAKEIAKMRHSRDNINESCLEINILLDRIDKLEAALDWIGHQPAMEYAPHIADKVCEMIGKGPLK